MATASAYTKVAQELYISYFGRPADSTGLLNMSAALAAAGAPTTTSGLDAAYASNASVRALMDSFGKSGESTVLYGSASTGFSTARFVTEVFHYLFGRAPAQSGLAFWTNAIDSGSLTLAAAAHSILTGAIVANGADAALIDKKVIFANHFTTALDTDTEVNAYRGAVAAQIGRDLLANVTAATDPGTSPTAVTATLAQLGKSIVLTTGADNLAGVSGPNLFVANIAGNSNTLQSGDRISAGDGVDTLRANVGVFQASALTPETQGVENVIVRADASISTTAPIEINAASMKGVTRWESKHSHGDLVIDHAGIANSQLPENVTVAMAGTDAGNVDFGVYFDTAALRALNPTAGGQTLRLQLMDTRSAEAGDAPLKGNPYDGFVFTFNGKPVQVRSPAIDQAQTYPELLAAIRAQVAVTPGLEKMVVSLGAPFEAYDTQYGHLQSGREILITNPGTGTMTTDDSSGWLSSLIPNDTMHKAMPIGPVAAGRALITSSVVLDGVGRGATGGDLVIGAKATSTVTQPGVEAFNITVENTSRLQTINSTYNRLETVNLVNGTSKGDVSVRGATDTADQPLPGLVGERSGSQHGDTYGFHDVRQVNAGAMKGKVDIEAIVSDLALAKYIDQPGSQTGARGESVDFIYLGGNNDDVVMLDITSNMAAKRGDRAAGLEDFRFKMGGGTGDDQLTLRILPSVQGNNSWMVNQDLNNNITLSGGNGNDTLRKPGAGDAVLDGGNGNDAIYAENSGLQEVLSFVAGQMNIAASTTYLGAQWVFNTADQMGLLAPAREFGALKSDALDTYKLAGTKVNVSFQGIGSSVTVGTTLSMTMPTDKDINEAITHAINDDPVLNQLLRVNDGPGSALIVHALIDGAMSPADLNIALQALDPASLTDAQVSAWAAAYGLTGGAVSTDGVFNVIQTSLAAFNANGDYASAMAVDHGAVHSITGVNSSAASDNLILPGMGNDVVVLGTALGASKAVSSNDTVVFDENFGNDTLVHFKPAGAGIDHLDFTALGGKTLTADLAVNKSITIVAAGTSNDTLAKISALFNAYNAETMTHVVALVDGTGNAAMIFSIEDVAGADNGKATMQGRIDLGTVNWHSALTQANFVDATSIGFSQAEGAAGVAATPVQLVGMTLPESGLAGA
ncbi:hypothetical protein PO883_31390 [Massilia sp. DJPM01]|uniref:hypothetical protein n=1 Tax=Massilia sp. DJPM01 TaxID=3024404 RepID=UPI00259DD47A|nr:hypothetical protein [Massilia sp. DJPM01]MDM5181685.1 hypothetical protein [Massilia sp. DJPM01]